jgi:cytochrome c biogenesis protein
MRILKIIANLKVAIVLLLTIAIIITIGSIIEQDKPLEFYQQNYPIETSLYGFINWKFIQFTGIDHIYKTFWFFGLLVLFGTSLITCTFLQQFPILKFSRRCNFLKAKILGIETLIKQENIGIFLNKIIINGYFVFQQKKNFYAIKGLIGRIAPVFVHLSIIMILFGAIIAAVCGFNAQELIPKSEIFHLQNTVISGPLSNFSQQPVRVNDFWINYYRENKIKQFYSDISILNEHGEEIINKTISVNEPLVYKNLTFYQTDWTIIGLRIKKDNIFFQLPVILSESLGNKVWLTWLPVLNTNLISTDKEKFLGKTITLNNYKEMVFCYNLKGSLEKDIDLHEFLLDNNYKFVDLIVSTGLQIKSDPGIFFIYMGFGFLMISTFLSYISFSQIWGIINILKNKKKLLLSAKTNRDQFSLNLEIFKLTKNL